MAFGFAYLGAFQWFIYVSVFSKLCPNAIRFANLPWAEKLKDKAGIRDLFKQTALDNFVHYTFIYFPIFYCFKEMIQSTDAKASPTELVSSALSKYWNNIVVDNLAMWSLWVPGDLLVYAIPIWMRLPLNHGISIVWTMILSYMRGGRSEEGGDGEDRVNGIVHLKTRSQAFPFCGVRRFGSSSMGVLPDRLNNPFIHLKIIDRTSRAACGATRQWPDAHLTPVTFQLGCCASYPNAKRKKRKASP